MGRWATHSRKLLDWGWRQSSSPFGSNPPDSRRPTLLKMKLEMFRTFSGLVYFAFLFVNLFLLNPLLCLCHKGVKDDGFRAEIADMLRRRRTFVNSDLCSSHGMVRYDADSGWYPRGFVDEHPRRSVLHTRDPRWTWLFLRQRCLDCSCSTTAAWTRLKWLCRKFSRWRQSKSSMLRVCKRIQSPTGHSLGDLRTCVPCTGQQSVDDFNRAMKYAFASFALQDLSEMRFWKASSALEQWQRGS